MSRMLAFEMLDRRALALIRPVDVAGRPVTDPIEVRGPGAVIRRRRDGSLALLSATGWESYAAAFDPPPSPAPLSRTLLLDLVPAGSALMPRRLALKLPRDPDPAKAGQPRSVFTPIDVEMLPGAGARVEGSGAAVRVSVLRKSDDARIEHALVRLSGDGGKLTARGLTDARGEAVLLIPFLSLAFPGPGATLKREIKGRVAVTVDSAMARFHPAGNAAPVPISATSPADPDVLGERDADFAGGSQVSLSSGAEVALTMTWKP